MTLYTLSKLYLGIYTYTDVSNNNNKDARNGPLINNNGLNSICLLKIPLILFTVTKKS